MKLWLVKKTSVIAAALTLGATVQPPPAQAAVPVFATEITQLLNHIELIDSYLKQVQMVMNGLNQYADMLKHGLTIKSQLFGAVQQDLVDLSQIVKGGFSLAYSLQNLDQTFKLRFVGYAPSTNYSQQYQTWSQTTLDTINGTLRSIGLQGNQLNSEQAVLNGLRQQSQTALGRMQAIEVGNQIGEQEVEQLMKLRAMMLADMQSKAAYQATQIQTQSTTQANSDAFFQNDPTQSDGVVF